MAEVPPWVCVVTIPVVLSEVWVSSVSTVMTEKLWMVKVTLLPSTATLLNTALPSAKPLEETEPSSRLKWPTLAEPAPESAGSVTVTSRLTFETETSPPLPSALALR